MEPSEFLLFCDYLVRLHFFPTQILCNSNKKSKINAHEKINHPLKLEVLVLLYVSLVSKDSLGKKLCLIFFILPESVYQVSDTQKAQKCWVYNKYTVLTGKVNKI